MNTPLRPILRKTHPLLLVAAGAVTLASLTATATLLGWLPAGHATTAQSLAAAALPASLANALPATTASLPASPTDRPVATMAAETPAAKPHKVVKAAAKPAAVAPPPTPVGAPAPFAAPPVPPDVLRSAAPAAPPPCGNCGEIEAVREIAHPGEGSGLGAVGGALAGGLLGNQVGRGKGNQLATLLGVVGGAFAGHQVEKNARAERDTEVIVRLDDGSTRSIVHDGAPVWRPGDRVRVVNGQLQSL